MKPKTPIAVVGMGGVFPGASDLDTFWKNIVNKRDAVCEAPEHRWIVRPDAIYDPVPAPDKAYSKRACLVRDFRFDPAGIDIDRKLLDRLDPLCHFALHAGREAFSSCVTSSLDKERVGVILAAIALPTDAASALTREILGRAFENGFGVRGSGFEATPRTPHPQPFTSIYPTSLPAALLARALGLGGGSFTLDAACASSLYAVKLACDELHSRRADAMLAGGVSRPECLYTQVGFSQLRALSPSGRCAPFDETADGLVVGEGAGIVVLKRLEDALRDGDTIYGVIRGIGLSNDIRGNLLAPDSEGQVRAMRSAYEASGWSPYDVDYIECHGAGTPVGDATELNSLHTLWRESEPVASATGQHNPQCHSEHSLWHSAPPQCHSEHFQCHSERSEESLRDKRCAIGSVKSMIGHLLTAAGAAGMIKTLLGLKHNILPPSLNFTRAAKGSPLHNSGSPFRVQTHAQEWRRRDKNTPLRAAVSSFGFGGINAHLLIEEGSEVRGQRSEVIPRTSHLEPRTPAPIAIVGMEAVFGSAGSLRELQETIFNGASLIRKRPKNRWKGADDIASEYLMGRGDYGAYMAELSLYVGEFRVPPNEIPDILPQQLLMLKVAAKAMLDAGLPLRKERPRMGVIIGADFDLEATNFHLRWNLYNQVQNWKSSVPDLRGIDDKETALWLESLRDACGPPLTAVRTLGALGGIIASRIAREFRFGGPSFIVSGDAASGMKAIEIGVRLLRQNEAETMLVGAIDLAGDVRNIIARDSMRHFSTKGDIRPFDAASDGTLPGEGAAALVLKRLDQAIADGDRIYAVIKGMGNAGGGKLGIEDSDSQRSLKKIYMLSAERAFLDADVSPDTVSYVEAHGSGDPLEDKTESDAVSEFFSERKESLCLGSVKTNIGHTGASAGLASVVKTALCLYHEILPPSQLLINSQFSILNSQFPTYWFRDRQDGPRRSLCAAMTTDGNCSHVVLEGFAYDSLGQIPERVINERKRPAGLKSYGLFVIEGDNAGELSQGLKHLQTSVLNSGDHIEPAARKWYLHNHLNFNKKYALSLVAADFSQLERQIAHHLSAITHLREPIERGDIAFVFPGSGNHYAEMGSGMSIYCPEILRGMDAKTLRLKTQSARDMRYITGGEVQASIFAQTLHGIAVSDWVRSFGVKPVAVIGYSLGESVGLFATETWTDRDEMLKRMLETNLFQTELAGPCNAARKAWGLAPDEPVEWRVAVINRPAEIVRETIASLPFVRLLIVNTPDECVIGGQKKQVETLVKMLKCEAVFLENISTVHCDAALPVAEAYKALHVFPTNPPRDIRFYSCALGRAHEITSESAAESILRQAISGFDFPALIRQAYQDGLRFFLEMGPQASCTRMINRILDGKPHLAVSADARGEDDYLTMLKFLGALIAERIPVNLDKLYGDETYPPALITPRKENPGKEIRIMIGGAGYEVRGTGLMPLTSNPEPRTSNSRDKNFMSLHDLIEPMSENIAATADAHRMFLDFSEELTRNFGKTFAFQTQLLGRMIEGFGVRGQGSEDKEQSFFLEPLTPHPEPAFTRALCMEFAVGSAGKVLGPEFDVVDTYKARVRLPDEPLMLVDRIISVEGEKASLTSGRVITEHDVFPGAWYLDGDRAPVCISVEAGQADLFLCSYLGIDLVVRGKRTYRLLDATIRFHRGLPRPGDVIRYEIEIEKFVRQGETYLFFFHFEGFIGNEHLITMRNGCAGFFTEEEVRNSGGIILTEDETKRMPGKKDFSELVPLSAESYDDAAVECLRQGNLAGCFGEIFAGVSLAESLRLPGGRMRLIDRILLLDPNGGRYGIGMIRAEADIHPDDWFLTCHFVDDRVMPGTLMYECCAHTLRVFLQRMGWVTDKPGVCYEPMPDIPAVLKCRGPVTPETKHVIYEVEISEIGYNPEPYVIADALMYADGRRIVQFKDMSMKITGITREEMERGSGSGVRGSGRADRLPRPPHPEPAFTRDRILAFAVGKPSEAFGEPYRIFDEERVIARLPGPPYFFMDSAISIDPEPWILKPGGWIEAEYHVSRDEWYFKADRSGIMPFCVLLEIALQPCGWLAAYLGSALKSQNNLKFRNLGGNAVLHHNILPEAKTLTMRCRVTKVSEAGDMIIEHFDMQILQGGKMIYEGDTYFGFFTPAALAEQVGIRGAKEKSYIPSSDELLRSHSYRFEDEAPLFPDDPNIAPAPKLAMPSTSLRMIDEIEIYIPDGGTHGLGFIRGIKKVNPDEWFFKAHFYQDPVCPGSLGIESFLQLLKFAAIERWGDMAETHRFEIVTEIPHHWTYRGQIIQKNKRVEVDAVITEIQNEPFPTIFADGYLKVDGLFIYQMEHFGLRLVPCL